MRFRCGSCGASQWRGLFPEPMFHIRWTVFHEIALGVCGVATRVLFTRFGYSTGGWPNGLASLGVCAVLLLGFYAVALFVEACVVARLRCWTCGVRGLRPDSGRKRANAEKVTDIVVGGLYAVRNGDGTYRIVKVLVVDEFAVHLRSYANRFKELPVEVSSSQLSLGGSGKPGEFGIGHFPLAREGFDHEERVLVGRESVADHELDGYRLWAGIDPMDE
jgi:hypothetical protein